MIDALRADLEHTRARLLGLVERVSDDVLAGQHAPVMGPILWDLGHIAAFEELWLVKAVDGWRPDQGGGLPPLFDAAVHQRSVRGELQLPDVQQSLARLEAVREATFERLGRGSGGDDPLTSEGFVWNMVAQHECWHIETILAALNLREDFVLDREPGAAPVPHDACRMRFPGGPVTIGTDDRSRAYDNERGAHRVELAPFSIASHPVTVGEFEAFVTAGGYAERALWSEAGWGWVHQSGPVAPHGWRDGGVLRFGRLVDRVPDEPVQHVCFHEAEAYARWAGARLPTELEWEAMARHGGEPDVDGAFVESLCLGPRAVGACGGAGACGAAGMLGNVWEWTSSRFAPYPGFEWFPYRDYSAPFFADGFPVLRGGSWATGRPLVRPTLRSWDLPIRRETIFVGFRLAWDD